VHGLGPQLVAILAQRLDVDVPGLERPEAAGAGGVA